MGIVMSNEIIVYLVLGVVVLVAVHVWLHRLLKFKMDESAIITFLKDAGGSQSFQLAQDISKEVKISLERVKTVCEKSQKIINSPQNPKAWGV
jgi:hypothetical protein